MKTGELLIEEGLVKKKDITMALEAQENYSVGKMPPLIGGLLCQWNQVTPLDLFTVLKTHGKLLRVGEILLREGKVTASQLEAAGSVREDAPKPFGQILVDKKFVTRREVYHALATQGNIPFSPLDGFFYGKEKVNTLAHFTGFAPIFEKGVIPLAYGNETLTIAVSRPDDMGHLSTLTHKNAMFRIKFLLIPEEKHRAIIEKFREATKGGAGTLASKKPVMVLTDPDLEIEKIDAMYFRYQMLKKGREEIDFESKNALFREFIRENHARIVKRFQCREVSYQLEEKEGRVLIHAFPGRVS